MKRISALLACLAGALVLVATDAAPIGRHVFVRSAPHAAVAQPPKGKVVVHAPPHVIERAPALSVAPVVVHKVPVVPVVIPKAAGANILIHEPGPAIIHTPVAPLVGKKFEQRIDSKNWVDASHARIVGGTGGPGGKTVVVEKVGPKSTAAIVGAFHARLGGRETFVAGGRTFNIRDTRRDLIDLHEKNWQHHLDAWHDRGLWVRGHLPPGYHNLYAPVWWNRFFHLRIGWWGLWPSYWTNWCGGFGWNAGWSWWHPCAWPAFIGWCQPTYAWAPGYYYDYGPGGNCVFDGGVVYIQGQPVCSVADYSNQAIQLAQQGDAYFANAPPPGTLQANWLPMGIWALCNETNGESTMFLQLTTTRQGVIAGTLYNTLTDDVQPVVGSVDPATQRAAWYIGTNKATVFETGVYNLTSPQTQVLVHFGPERTQTWMMVRTDGPPKQ
jgi:hypothetical protein